MTKIFSAMKSAAFSCAPAEDIYLRGNVATDERRARTRVRAFLMNL
jgi:hypothetical protein